ncbi:MAG: hypothetical protein WBA97_06845 [Actinophytocola sp.]|uniref:hypothetical protein n=1 Tax=Actinophytocola sp. TaxID=1872138 RepID=UPI003C730631
MSRHARTEPIIDDTRLIVSLTSHCFSRLVTPATGLPRLVIDYGGAALVLAVADPVDAEAFAFGLAHDTLGFGDHCRRLMNAPITRTTAERSQGHR